MIPQFNGFDDSNFVKETSSQTEDIDNKETEVETEMFWPKEDSKKKENTSTFKICSERNEEDRKVNERNQEGEAKASGSWCYECKDKFMNNTVLKMHMPFDH